MTETFVQTFAFDLLGRVIFIFLFDIYCFDRTHVCNVLGMVLVIQ